MDINKLTPGMTVFNVSRRQMGNTTLRTVSIFSVTIHSVDLERQTCIASWNRNPARTYYSRDIRKWREKKPKLVAGVFGQYRLAKRGEVTT